MKDLPPKLRSDPIWKDTLALVENIYSKLDELASHFPDEKWTTTSKLRNSSNDSLFYVAQALGNHAVDASEYDWNNARKHLFALQAMYIFATKQKFLELEPDVIVKIDDLLEKIDIKIAEGKEQAEKKINRELEPWLEKYRLWQAMQDK